MQVQLRQATQNQRIDSDYYVEGYATTYDRYLLFKDLDGKEYYEQIDINAFRNTKMNNVIFQYDHEGRIYARQTNNTLGLEVNDNGLFMWADLSKTQNARNMFEDIQQGMVVDMSWRFMIRDQKYDSITRTFHILDVEEIYDVSAVSIPANPGTSIYARNKQFLKQMETEQKRKKKQLELLFKLGGM